MTSVISPLTLAVDPGIRGCGVALFDRGVLVDAKYVANPCTKGDGAAEVVSMASFVVGSMGLLTRHVAELAVEWPQVYASRIRAGQSKEDPNDLIALAAVDAAIAALLSPVRVTSYAPAAWKGQLPKEACHARIATRLSQKEELALGIASSFAKSKAHNVWDAVGIGLHHLGRFERKRVIP